MNARTPTKDKISLEALSLRYRSGVQALDAVDLEIESGLLSNTITYILADGPNIWIATDASIAKYDQ